MTRPLSVFIFLLIASAFGRSKDRVIFTSPCSCEGNHGVARWQAKTDPQLPPANSSMVQRVTPADICAWAGPGEKATGATRLPAEEKWYALEGRIETVKVEEDGDLHIEMTNADRRPGRVVVELPLGDTWCEMRKSAFSWTNASFPVMRGQFKTVEHPIVTVVGKAFYDVDHAGTDMRNNQRGQNAPVAVWEIHPVMELKIDKKNVAELSTQFPPRPTPEIQQTARPSIAWSPTATPQEFATIVQPITIKIPYGTTVLRRGMRLPVVSRDAQTVRVRYMNEIYLIPVFSTDLK